MSDRVASFLLLCRCLSRADGPAAGASLSDELRRHDIDWMEIVRIANHHFVAPALWQALQRKGAAGSLPGDVGDFLELTYRHNVARNERLKDQACKVAAALNACGVEPIILKGGVRLFEGSIGNSGDRMMIDLDFLVPAHQFTASVGTLKDRGYSPVGDIEGWTYQYPPLVRAGEVASVEIHRDVGEQKTMITSEAAFRGAVELDTAGVRLKALSLTHRIVHNVFHSRIQDRNHELGVISLKHLDDFVATAGRHGPHIDWDAVSSTMYSFRMGAAWESYVLLAERLLGLSPPSGIRRGRRSVFHYNRCLLQLRWDWMMAAANTWATLTHPFQRCHISYIYGCGANPISLMFYRLVHGYKILRRRKFAVFAKIKTTRKAFYDSHPEN